MTNRAHMEAVDHTLRDLRISDKIFGGVTFLFGGDSRQILPVVAKGTQADIIKACLKTAALWHYIKQLHLRTNMRAHLSRVASEFPHSVLSIGNASMQNIDESVTVDSRIGKVVHSLRNEVYPDIENILSKPYNWLYERVVVWPGNVAVDEINSIAIKKTGGEIKEYASIDTVLNLEDDVHYPTEFLNSLTPAGLPPHKLTLTNEIPVIL